ncbi:MAG: hypothetical protein SGI92_16900 [Bryobacteraceae bacterium]|nr:hypothetical protein [Bryobacteraceae bacterium]
MRIIALLLLGASLWAQPSGGPVWTTGYHLTARPWKPTALPRVRLLDYIEGVQLQSGRNTALEADRRVEAKLGPRTIRLEPWTPVTLYPEGR